MMINLRAFSGPTSNIQDDDDDEKRKGFMLANMSHERASLPSGLVLRRTCGQVGSNFIKASAA